MTAIGSRTKRGILALDEGTTGTRAAIVFDDGAIGPIHYRQISVTHPDTLSVEQDPAEIWSSTLDVARSAIAWADDNRVEITAVALSVQRATVMLWDRKTGEPLLPAVVWQDRRYSQELRGYESKWDSELRAATGRPVGSRAPMLWAMRQIAERPRLGKLYSKGRVQFGTVDTWIAWKLTRGAVHAISSTNACSLGVYALGSDDWHYPWIAELGFPAEMLPALLADDGDFGMTDPDVLGIKVPIAAAMGDQHAALIALRALERGQGMCMHGTGTFVDVAIGTRPLIAANDVDGVLSLVGYRSGSETQYTLESYCSTTGSALSWLTDELRFFDSPMEISRQAATVASSSQTWFVPALAGIRTPSWRPEATGALSGLSLASTRAQVARAIIDGIAHSVTDVMDGMATTMGTSITQICVGGGLSSANALMQAQADFVGMPIERVVDSDSASLRGAAYLAGARVGMWSSVAEIANSQPRGMVFEPKMDADTRAEFRAGWKRNLAPHLEPIPNQPIGGSASTPAIVGAARSK